MRNKVINGDALTELKKLRASSVQCVITSPPYFGLRNYAVRGQIGLEATPEKYVERLVEVFREIRRVLKKDGVAWLNLGDSYFGSWGNYSGSNRGAGHQRTIVNGSRVSNPAYKDAHKWRPPTAANSHPFLKKKDLIGIPWRVAFALQMDGWYLRQDIVWSKSNPMPESVGDRCTRSHEYIFLLSKSRRYYFNSKAIRTAAKRPYKGVKKTWEMRKGEEPSRHDISNGVPDLSNTVDDGKANKRSVWNVATKPFKFRKKHFAVFPLDLIEPCVLAGSRKGGVILDPFLGSGTVAVAAKRHKRRYIGIELNKKYVRLAKMRIAKNV